MVELKDFPALNASLNGLSGICLVAGYAMIRGGHRRAHGVCMIAAVAVSVVFLACYLYYHAHAGSTRFTAEGWIRPVYFTILLSHTVLAAVVALWLAPVTVYRAARRRWDAHRRLARWTLPIWLYVSVTGVFIYFMLYRWYA